MKLTNVELRQALDRAIQRAVRRVTADDDRTDDLERTRLRLQQLIDREVARFEKNLADNGEGIVRVDVDVLGSGPDRPLELYVYMERQR